MLTTFLRATLATSGAKVVALLAGLGTLAVTSRVLGPEGRGYVAVIATWVALAATLGHLSLGQVALNHAQTADRRDWLPPTLWTLLATATAVPLLAVAVVTGLDVAGVIDVLGRVPTSYLLLALATLPLTLWTGYSSYLLLSLERLSASNRAQVAGAVVTVTGAFLLVAALGAGVAGALAATLLGQIAVVGVGLVALRRAGAGRPHRDWTTARRLVANGSKLHLNAIGAFLFASLDVLMVNHFKGKAAAGFYQVAFQLYVPLLIVPQAVTEVLSSRLTSLGVRGLWPFQKRLILLVGAVMTAGAAVLAGVAPLLIGVVAGPDFGPSTDLFRIYMCAVPAAVLNGAMAVQWIGRGLFLQVSAITIAAGLLNFCGNLLLIPRYGAAGAAWATVVGVYCIPFTANVTMWVRCERERRTAAADGPSA